MKEVEIKAQLKNKEQVIQKLKDLGCTFEPVITQEDTVYALNVGTLKDFNSNEVFLRLRIKNGKKILFTLKKRLSNNLDALEYEVEVSSIEKMEQALFLMGYKEAVKVSKTRIITHYDSCEICIDEIKGLGSFIEMEKLMKEGDSEKVQNELFVFFKTLGISEKDRVFNGYDILLLQQKES